MMLTTLLEIISIGAVLPFLTVLTAPDKVLKVDLLKPLFNMFNISEANQLIFPITIVFIIAVIISSALRLLLLWGNNVTSFKIGSEISANIFHRTLHQPYQVHCNRNSSEVIGGITLKSNDLIHVISMALSLMSAILMTLAVSIILFHWEPLITIAVIGSFSLIYFMIVFITKDVIEANSKQIAFESTRSIRLLQEGLGGIRDILLNGTQDEYSRAFKKSDLRLRRAQSNSLFIAASPRYIIEVVLIAGIASFACYIASNSINIIEVIPIFGFLVLGSQRLMPMFQQAYSSWTGLKSAQNSLDDVLEFLNQNLPPRVEKEHLKSLPFESTIIFRDVKFRYAPDSPNILNNLNLKIYRGDRIGIIGKTGSGKTTLADLMMCLLTPSSGTIEIDGQDINELNRRNWQLNIAHVPQAIYLADCSIQENIAFGVPIHMIDEKRVESAAKQSHLNELIESWPMGYKTFTGENGVRLSGGQRQRIGIARALYKNAKVIIFDEATSALDAETEQSITDTIESLDRGITLLVIAHRITTLKTCNRIMKLERGSFTNIGSYQDIFSKAEGNINNIPNI